MPAASATARTPPPAITPVPGEAGRNSTRAPSYSPITSWGIVFSFNETFSMALRAASEAFRIASDTSFALPNPHPTFPSWSPATISALKLKRRPPFTTFAQRLMNTTFSVVSPFTAGARSVLRSGRLLPVDGCAMSLELQSARASRICQSFHFALILKPATIEHHFVDLLSKRPFGNDLAHDFGSSTICRRLVFAEHIFLRCRCCDQSLARIIIDHLRVNVL